MKTGKKIFGVCFALAALLLAGCENPTSPAPVEQSAAPTADITSAAKAAEVQKAVRFTLTSAKTGTWNVYDVETGSSALADVSVAFSAPTLTLTATGNDLADGTYYVSVTESGKTESARLGLTVTPQERSATPAANVSSVFKTAEVQKAVSFTLTSASTGTWNVYGGTEGGPALADVSVAFADSVLTLTASGENLTAGDYWVTVTESGKTESLHLKLSVVDPVTLAEPKLIVRNMSAEPGEEATTANSDSFINLESGVNSYSWTGNATLENAESGTFGNSFSKLTLAYIPSPAPGKFTWTAKIALRSGSDTLNADGLMFGVFTDLPETLPEATSSADPPAFIYFAGARHVFSGVIRGYFTRSTAIVATTSLETPNNEIGDDKVYTYKVVWDGSQYLITITKPDATILSTEVTTSNQEVAPELFTPAQGRYPGFGVVDGSAVITALSLTFDG